MEQSGCERRNRRFDAVRPDRLSPSLRHRAAVRIRSVAILATRALGRGPISIHPAGESHPFEYDDGFTGGYLAERDSRIERRRQEPDISRGERADIGWTAPGSPRTGTAFRRRTNGDRDR